MCVMCVPECVCGVLCVLQAGAHVKEAVVHGLISLVTNAEELQPYAVRRLHAALLDALASPSKGAPSLLYAAAWCIGEYGEMLPTGGLVGGRGWLQLQRGAQRPEEGCNHHTSQTNTNTPVGGFGHCQNAAEPGS